MTARIATPSLIRRYTRDNLLTVNEGTGILRRGFSADSKDRADTKPVLNFLRSIRNGTTGSPLQFQPKADGDSMTYANENGYTAYCGSPRNLQGASGSGQRFRTAGLVSGKPELIISGASKKAYTLKFELAAKQVEVEIPKGASARGAAKKIADAINAASGDIARSDDGSAFGDWTDSALGGVTATAKGSSVFIAPDIHD